MKELSIGDALHKHNKGVKAMLEECDRVQEKYNRIKLRRIKNEPETEVLSDKELELLKSL